MKIFINTASPYVRRALIAAHEKNLANAIETIEINPWIDPEDLHANTPIGRLPALVLDDGSVLVESLIIAEYFNEIGEGPDLMGANKFETLARAGIAQGIIDSTYLSVIEGRRPEEKRWPELVARHGRVLERTIATASTSDSGFDLGDITLVAALGYLDFRLPENPWRQVRPDLAAWLDGHASRPSVQATKPAG